MSLWRSSLKTLIGKKNLVGCEVGVETGRHALNILENLDISKLYLIDSYKGGYKKFQEPARVLLKPYPQVTWIIKRSQDVTDDIPEGILDFAYIDGSHRYKDVSGDLEIFWRKVKPGGLLCGHDFKYVKQAVEDFARKKELQIFSDTKDRQRDWWIIKK